MDHATVTADDEIDLRELVSLLIDGWRWLLGTLMLGLLLGLWLALTPDRLYQTELQAVAAPSSQFSALNAVATLGTEAPGNDFLTPAQVLQDYRNRLASVGNFERFASSGEWQGYLAQQDNVATYFQRNVSLALASDQLTLSYRYGHASGPELLNAYAIHTAERLWATYLEQLSAQNTATLGALNRAVDAQQQRIVQERQQRLFELDTAITIARALDVAQPTLPYASGRQGDSNEWLLASVQSEDGLPLYFLGYQALEAERAALGERLDQQLMDEGIRELQVQINQRHELAALLAEQPMHNQISAGEYAAIEQLVTLLDPALAPSQAVAPKRALILLLAALGSGMLGVILVFVVAFANSTAAYRREKRRTT